MGLTEQDVATRAGLTLEDVRRFASLGILKPAGTDGAAYAEADVLRARLALALNGSGITPEELGQGIARGIISFDFADLAMQAPIGLTSRSYTALADELGLSRPFLEAIRSALGASRAPADAPAREDDAELLRMAAFGGAMGFTEDVMVRTLRVVSENVRRIVDFELELFRTQIEEPLILEGMTEQQVLDQMAALRGQLEPLSGRLVELLHRRHEEHAFFHDVTEHIERALDAAGISRRRTTSPPAIAYLEVSGYSRRADSKDDGPEDYPIRLGDIVQDALNFEGHPVSILGDVVMLVFADPCEGVHAALHLVDRIGREGLPTARVGLQAGPVVVRDGEYFGKTVNTARRIGEYARPREVLVTEEVRTHCLPDGGVAFEELGAVPLRGEPAPINLYQAAREVSPKASE
jgi:adenylate cyclase